MKETISHYYEVYLPSDQCTFSDGNHPCTEEGLQKCREKIEELRKPKRTEYDEYWASVEIRIRKVTTKKRDIE